jgi:hypothetical protein
VLLPPEGSPQILQLKAPHQRIVQPATHRGGQGIGPLGVVGGLSQAEAGKGQLRPMMAWVDSVPMGLVRTIGVLEVLAAIGLILPPLTGTAPWRDHPSRQPARPR